MYSTHNQATVTPAHHLHIYQEWGEEAAHIRYLPGKAFSAVMKDEHLYYFLKWLGVEQIYRS